MNSSSQKIAFFAVISGFAAIAGRGLAISNAGSGSPEWFFEFSDLKPSLEIPLKDNAATISLPLKKMKLRAKKAHNDERVEPFAFYLRKDDEQIASVARKFAKEGMEVSLSNYLKSNIDNGEILKRGAPGRNVYISKSAFQLIDTDKFVSKFQQVHHRLTVLGRELAGNLRLQDELINQVQDYLSDDQRGRIERDIVQGAAIDVDRDLLPSFAKKMVGKFTIYRGPNCFHAALAFQDRVYTDSPRFNIQEERGYHRSMINYDELWRVLSREFYEVDVSKATLKYGDIITFFEIPSKSPGPVDFRWIRHAASYLFNGYTFSKGSKSPNTPYTVKTLKEEWDTWSASVNLMAVKVFRKTGKSVKSGPANELTDWLY